MRTDTYFVEEESLSTRKKADKLIERISRHGYDQIDFSNVDFVSRSFADEVLKKSREKEVQIKGLNGNVEETFSVVAAE